MTKEQLIAECKKQNPKMVSIINGEEIELKGEAYEEACNSWAEMRLIQIELEELEIAKAKAKADLLAKLGLSIGLTIDELKAALK